VGNRTQEVKTLSGTTTTKVLAYPATSNRLSSETTNGTLSRSFTYDGAGNLLTGLPAGATYSFTYDQRNRPHWLRLNGTVVGTYLFNGLEQLSSRIIAAPLSPAGTTHYIYDLDGHLIAEAFGTSASTAVIVREYIWLEGMPVMAIDGVNTATPTLMAVHVDHLGRPIRMTNTTKNQVWNALWTPFGTAHSITGSATQNLRFPGQYFLIEQGMHYNWHRFYDATTGRYTQPDPLGFVDGPSRYAYALNSPLMFIDEDGHTSRVRPGIPIPAPLPQSKPVDKWGYPLAKYCPPPPPGDCDPDTQRRLQDDVNYACKQPRKCTQGMSSSELTTNMIRNRSCGNARNLINKKCFRGGDAEHREEADNAFHSLAKCESLISSASQ
jgi:RHS repeat-associated protein